MLFFGGSDITKGPLADAWKQPNAGSWSKVGAATNPSRRYSHSMAYNAGDGYSYLFGGTDGLTFNNETWKWDGTTWTKIITPAGTPTSRFGHNMVTDGYNHVILFGGIGTSNINHQEVLGDTYYYASGVWTPVTSAIVPTERAFYSMAYDGTYTVMWGGQQSGQFLQDMWRFNGSTLQWSAVAQGSLLPKARKCASMVYDSVNAQLMLFGGLVNDGHVSNETWIFKNGAWSLLATPAHPTRRHSASMVFNSGTNKIVLFGGTGSDGAPLGDVWTFDTTAKTWSGAGDFSMAQATGKVF